jgi:hypothetical protein
MLVAWRRVHRRKCMRGGGTAREESRGTGASGEDVGLGRHDYMWMWVRRNQGGWGYKDRRLVTSGETVDREWSWVDEKGMRARIGVGVGQA